MNRPCEAAITSSVLLPTLPVDPSTATCSGPASVGRETAGEGAAAGEDRGGWGMRFDAGDERSGSLNLRFLWGELPLQVPDARFFPGLARYRRFVSRGGDA